MGKAIDKRMRELGATQVYPLGCADEAMGLDDFVEPWLEGLWELINNSKIERIVTEDQELPQQPHDEQPQLPPPPQKEEEAVVITTATGCSPVTATTGIAAILIEDQELPQLPHDKHPQPPPQKEEETSTIVPVSICPAGIQSFQALFGISSKEDLVFEMPTDIPRYQQSFIKMVILDDAQELLSVPASTTNSMLTRAHVSEAKYLSSAESEKKVIYLELDTSDSGHGAFFNGINYCQRITLTSVYIADNRSEL